MNKNVILTIFLLIIIISCFSLMSLKSQGHVPIGSMFLISSETNIHVYQLCNAKTNTVLKYLITEFRKCYLFNI